MPLALEGYRVLDFTHVAAGPSCTQLLADFGADVIKIERISPDGNRPITGFRFGAIEGEPMLFLCLNRNKRGMAIDLRKPEGKEMTLRLAERCDVVVQNFRPDVMDRLGLGYQDLCQRKPDIIYASISGFGLTGPYAFKGGQDLIAQALGGVMSITGEPDDLPTPSGASAADFFAGILLAQGITMALLVKERTGLGQELSVSLLDGQLMIQVDSFSDFLNFGQQPLRGKRPLYGVYKARDGYIALNGGGKFPGVLRALGLERLQSDPRFHRFDSWNRTTLEDGTVLQAELAGAVAARTKAECLAALEAEDVLCGEVLDYAGVTNDPQIAHNQMICELAHPAGGTFRGVAPAIKLSKTPAEVSRRPPPLLGQHNEEICSWLGFSEEEIDAMRTQGVIG